MKIVQGGVVLLVVLLIGGGTWFLLSEKEESNKVSSVTNESITVPSSESGAPKTIPEQSSMVRSVKEAMGMGGQMRCTYTSGEGAAAMTSIVLVAGERFYTQVVTSGVTTAALYDGNAQYVWTIGSTQGMKMTKACLENLKASIPQDAPSSQSQAPTDYQNMFDMAQNVQCESIETDPIDTLLPKEVVFSDQCAMLEQGKKMMEQYQKKLPADMPQSFPVQY